MVHTAGRNEEHADEDKLKLTVFNEGKARQGRADTQEHRGVTSRPDPRRVSMDKTRHDWMN